MSQPANIHGFSNETSPAVELKQFRFWLRNGDTAVSGYSDSHDLSRALGVYLDFLRQQLLTNCESADIGQVQEMLQEVSTAVRAGRAKDRGWEFGQFIDGLVDIYSQGYARGQCRGFVETVEVYADVIDSLARELPSYDYDAALQQLFLYMNRMFSVQHKGWLELYGYFAAMPTNIRVVQLLRQNCFDEINEWVEGGVQNLFQLRTDFYSQTLKLERRQKLLEQELARLHNRVSDIKQQSVVDLKQSAVFKTQVVLGQKLEKVISELDEKRYLLGIIDSNITEFNDLLAEARRSIFMRVVPRNAQLVPADNYQPQSLEALIMAANKLGEIS